MRLTTPAIVVALRPHGEYGAVVRLMTPEHGLRAAYVRGARGRRRRPVLMPSNQVEAARSARTDSPLAQGTVELIHSRGPLLQEPLPAAAIDWVCALTATALTPAVWPARVCVNVAVRVSQTRTVPSSEPETAIAPSADSATDVTDSVWPCKG